MPPPSLPIRAASNARQPGLGRPALCSAPRPNGRRPSTNPRAGWSWSGWIARRSPTNWRGWHLRRPPLRLRGCGLAALRCGRPGPPVGSLTLSTPARAKGRSAGSCTSTRRPLQQLSLLVSVATSSKPESAVCHVRYAGTSTGVGGTSPGRTWPPGSWRSLAHRYEFRIGPGHSRQGPRFQSALERNRGSPSAS